MQKKIWQTAYGDFSFSSSKLDLVKSYIKNQKEHHRKVSYKEDPKLCFKEYGLEVLNLYV